MASHEQLCLCETPTLGHVGFLLFSGPRHPSSRARKTSTFINTQENMQPRWRQLPQKPARARFTSETKNNIAPFCGQESFFLAMPGRDLRLQITSAVTKCMLMIRCRLVHAKRSLSKHLKIASVEIVRWLIPNTLF